MPMLQVKVSDAQLETLKAAARFQGETMTSLVTSWIDGLRDDSTTAARFERRHEGGPRPAKTAEQAAALLADLESVGAADGGVVAGSAGGFLQQVLAQLTRQSQLLALIAGQRGGTPSGQPDPAGPAAPAPVEITTEVSPHQPLEPQLTLVERLFRKEQANRDVSATLVPCVVGRQLYQEDDWEKFTHPQVCIVTLANGIEVEAHAIGEAPGWVQVKASSWPGVTELQSAVAAPSSACSWPDRIEVELEEIEEG